MWFLKPHHEEKEVIIMTRTKLADRTLPNYTVNEERANSISHFAGAFISLPVLTVFPLIAARNHNTTGVIACTIFGACLVLLYLMSGIYHGLPRNTYVKKVFQVIDHCTIFLLIAGSYTAIVMGTLLQEEPVASIIILAIIWIAAAVGITLNAIDLKRFKVFSMCCYLMMGWLIIFKAKSLATLMGSSAMALLVIGGVCYTVGAVFYGLGKSKPYAHFVFHILTVMGSIAHIICAGMIYLV